MKGRHRGGVSTNCRRGPPAPWGGAIGSQHTFIWVRSEAGPALATQYSSCIFFMSASEGCACGGAIMQRQGMRRLNLDGPLLLVLRAALSPLLP